jgi:type I restriction enzyme, S subunit
MKKVRIGDLLIRAKECLNIDDDIQYKRVTIRMYHKGVSLRDVEKGINIGTKSQYLVHSGQFIVSRIDARNGAFGIIPDELEGAIITNDFLSFEVNNDLVDIRYFELYTQTQAFLDFCIRGSTGTTNRKRLKEELFLNFEVTIPEKPEQIKVIEKYERLKSAYDTIEEELKQQMKLKEQLQQGVLQEAIQGKLVPQDPNDEPASVLLKRIKEEKERLIKEGKIKKQKPLPEITEDEIPYNLPKGWEWVRLGDITTIKGGKRIPVGYSCTDTPTDHIYIRVTDMKYNSIDDTDLKYVTEDVYSKIKDYIIEKDDLYITIAGTIGKVGVIPEKFHHMNLTENAARIIIHRIDKYYLLYSLFSDFMQNQFIDKTNQVGQPKLALIRLKTSLIPVPPLVEQKRIVEKISQLLSLCDELEKRIEISKNDSELLLHSVLQETFASV